MKIFEAITFPAAIVLIATGTLHTVAVGCACAALLGVLHIMREAEA